VCGKPITNTAPNITLTYLIESLHQSPSKAEKGPSSQKVQSCHSGAGAISIPTKLTSISQPDELERFAPIRLLMNHAKNLVDMTGVAGERKRGFEEPKANHMCLPLCQDKGKEGVCLQGEQASGTQGKTS
jgi:hypothetical protein